MRYHLLIFAARAPRLQIFSSWRLEVGILGGCPNWCLNQLGSQEGKCSSSSRRYNNSPVNRPESLQALQTGDITVDHHSSLTATPYYLDYYIPPPSVARNGQLAVNAGGPRGTALARRPMSPLEKVPVQRVDALSTAQEWWLLLILS